MASFDLMELQRKQNLTYDKKYFGLKASSGSCPSENPTPKNYIFIKAGIAEMSVNSQPPRIGAERKPLPPAPQLLRWTKWSRGLQHIWSIMFQNVSHEGKYSSDMLTMYM